MSLAWVRRAIAADSGQGLVEYAMIISTIVVILVGGVLLLGHQVVGFYQQATACFQSPTTC